jgi:hypothetical protein
MRQNDESAERVRLYDFQTRSRTLCGRSGANRQSKASDMAVVKHLAMNLLHNPKDTPSLKVRRKGANLNQDYRGALIRQTLPLT